MKFLFTCLFLFLVTVSGYTQSYQQEQKTIQVVAQIMHAFKSDQGKRVWPGYDIARKPVVINFENGHIYAFNLQKRNRAWKTLSMAGETVLFSEKDLWQVREVQMHPCFPIDGQEAFVFQFDGIQDGSHIPFFVFIHERFHQHQFENFPEPPPFAEYVDHFHVENLSLASLEEKLLVGFLETRDRDKLKDFIAVNRARRTLIQPSSYDWEMDQQTMEGLADYAGLKALEAYEIFPGFDAYSQLLRTVRGDDAPGDLSDRAIRWRHYGVGSTIAYALDHLNVSGWKQQVQDRGVNLIQLLEQELPLSDAEAQSRLYTAKATYQYDEMRRHVWETVGAYQKDLANLERRYASLQGVPIVLGSPPLSMSGGGMSLQTYHRADGSTLVVDDTSYSISDDNSWTVRLNHVPFLFQHNTGEREFKIDRNLVVKLDNRSYRLRDLQRERSFRSISLTSKQCELSSKRHPGTICVRNGKLVIAFAHPMMGA